MIGAGAAGTMAAIAAAGAGAEVVLLERTRDGGRKILISDGGRCNVLPARLDESRFVTDSRPHTLRKLVRSWPLAEQVAFFERDLGLPLVEEPESGKLFPRSDRARDVRDGLLALAARRGARLVAKALVVGLVRGSGGWLLILENGAGRGRRRRRGGRRALGAEHRQRRPGPVHAGRFGPHHPPDVSRAHPDHL